MEVHYFLILIFLFAMLILNAMFVLQKMKISEKFSFQERIIVSIILFILLSIFCGMTLGLRVVPPLIFEFVILIFLFYNDRGRIEYKDAILLLAFTLIFAATNYIVNTDDFLMYTIPFILNKAEFFKKFRENINQFSPTTFFIILFFALLVSNNFVYYLMTLFFSINLYILNQKE